MPEKTKNSPPPHTYAVGDVIRVSGNAFRVLGHLGAGGMGEVYRVIHQKLGSTIVLKLLRADAAEDARIKELFLNEGRILSRISNSNVVRAFDANETKNGEHYYLMENLHGMSLAEFLSRKNDSALRLYTAIDFGFQLFRGLRAVHESGVIHRDIKPQNLIIHRADGDQFLKIIDFGIIKLVSDTKPDETFIGTVPYASPEQIRKENLTTAVDIFAAGLVLFELLTGHRPYGDVRRWNDLIARSYVEAPSLAGYGRFPPKLVELVDQTLSLDPKKRPTAVEAGRIFEPIKHALPGYDKQRMVTADGLLKDPTESIEPITQAALESPTDPDGMDFPWLAEARKAKEAEDASVVYGRNEDLPDTRLGGRAAAQGKDRRMVEEEEQILPFATTKPRLSIDPPKHDNRTAPMPPPVARARHDVATVEVREPAQPHRGFDTGPVSTPPPTPMPISLERKLAGIRELDSGGRNWQQALSSQGDTRPPNPAPQRLLVPGRDKIPGTDRAEGKRSKSVVLASVALSVLFVLALAIVVEFAFTRTGKRAAP